MYTTYRGAWLPAYYILQFVLRPKEVLFGFVHSIILFKFNSYPLILSLSLSLLTTYTAPLVNFPSSPLLS